jgi:hypothetical protein
VKESLENLNKESRILAPNQGRIEVVIEKKKTNVRPAARQRKKATVEEVEDEGEPASRQTPAVSQPRKEIVETLPEQELPYRNVPPVTFATRPADSRRTAVNETNPVPTPAVGKKEKHYKLKAPIDDSDSDQELDYIAEIVKAMEVGLPLKSLLKLSPRLRKKAKEALTKVRVPINGVFELLSLLDESEVLEAVDGLPPDELIETMASSFVQSDAISTRELPFNEQLTVLEQADGLVPKGALVVGDPVLQYLANLPAGHAPRQIFVAFKDLHRVAGESESLRVLYPLINGSGEQEAICDGGSQIVSMSQAAAVELGLGWDPSVTIFMQSANGQVEKSVGLSKNVAFRFGEVTLYLQVHIIKNPAYKVLLGRPFEVLAGSGIQNGTDGSQLITLTDPNTQKQWVVPTFPRGTVRQLKKVRDSSTEIPDGPAEPATTSEGKFQASMN